MKPRVGGTGIGRIRSSRALWIIIRRLGFCARYAGIPLEDFEQENDITSPKFFRFANNMRYSR